MIGPPGPAYGDTISGTNLAGGIAAALLKRERTGEPSVVDVSLLGSGLWSMGHTVALTKHLGQLMEAPPPGVHGSPINPLVGVYATSDDRYISLVMMQPDQVLGRRVPAHRSTRTDRRSALRHRRVDRRQHRRCGRDPDQSHRNPHACRVERTLCHACRTVGAGAGHPAGGRRRADPGQRISRARRRTRIGRQPGAVRRRRTADRPGPGFRRADRRDSCRNSDWTGTASSSSRRPAPSPRKPE